MKTLIRKRMVFPILFCLTVFFDAAYTAPHDNPDSAEFQARLRFVEKLMNEHAYERAEEEIKNILTLDDDCSRAHILYSDLLLIKGTVNDRTKAEKEALSALRCEPDNMEYHFALIKVYNAQGFDTKVVNYLENLREKYPENPEVLCRLGRLYSRRAFHLRDMASRVGDQKLMFTKSYRKKLNEAKEIYNRLAGIAPHYSSMDMDRALLTYMEGDWEGMIRQAQSYLDTNPGKRKAHLILGLALLRDGRYKEAEDRFDRFNASLTPHEKRFFETFDLYLSETQQAEIETLDSTDKDEFHNDFWVSRDPLFITGYNERLLEHYARVAESQLLFSSPAHDMEGWKTDRGVIWVRYGQPLRIERDLNMQLPNPKKKYMIENTQTEIWLYRGFHFKFFEYPLWSGKAHFWYGASVNGFTDYKQIADDIQKKLPDMFEINIPGKRIDFPRLAADFRGHCGKTRIELYHGVPLNELKYHRENEQYVTHIDNGVFVFDEGWDRLIDKTWREEHMLHTPERPSAGEMLTMHNRFEVPPGDYTLALEFKENSSGNIGAVRDPLKIERYGYDSLEVSDILLAEHIEPKPVDNTGSIFLDDLIIRPCISRRFRTSENIFLYFEIYNLMMTGVPGNSRYRVEYAVQYKRSHEDEKWSIGSMLGRLFNFSDNRYQLATSAEYEGINPVEYMYLEIEPALLETGLYLMTLSVTDIIAGRTFQKNAGFYLIE